MARCTFGGGTADAVWSTVTTGNNHFINIVTGTHVTMWSAQTGGTQYTDLLDANSSPITYVTSGAGGQLPLFSGPDGITTMWADAGGSTRVRLDTSSSDTVIAGRVGDSASATRGATDALYAGRNARNGFVPRPGAGVARRLKDKSSAVILGLVGDSTGDQVGEWFDLTVNWLAAQAPTVTVKEAWFSDTAQGYGIPQVIQTGTTEASVAFAGGANYITSPDNAQVSLTGDIAGSVDCALSDWTPASNSPALLTKFGAAGQRSFRFYVEQTTGLLVLSWYPDGATSKTCKSSVAPTVTDGSRLRVGFELDVDDGAGSHAVRFYVSSGTNGWTQLGTTQVAAGGGTTSVFDSTTNLCIGSRLDSGVDTWTGTLWRGHYLSGMLQTGKVVAGYDPALYPAMQGNQTLIGVAGETWNPVGAPTITYSPMLLAYNGSVAGTTISYSADTTRLPLQTPIAPHLFFISYGHNQTDTATAEWDALATQVRTRWPLAPIVGVAQNPQKSPRLATQIARQAQIAAEIHQIAALRGYGLLNAYEAVAVDMTNNVQSDGIHPTPAGSAAWANEAKQMFLPWPTI